MVLARLTPTEGTAEASRQSYLFRRIGWFDPNTAALFRRIGWFDPNTAALSLWLRLSSLDHEYGHGPDPDPSWPDDLQDRPTVRGHDPDPGSSWPDNLQDRGDQHFCGHDRRIGWFDPNTSTLFRRIGWFDTNTAALFLRMVVRPEYGGPLPSYWVVRPEYMGSLSSLLRV